MRPFPTLSGVALSLTLIGFATSDDAVPLKKGAKAPPPATVPKAADKTKPSAEEPTAPAAAVSKYPADELAIRNSAEAFCKAYCAGDAAAIAELFTEDAEYVDEHGEVYQGRKKISELLTSVFTDQANFQLDVTIDSIRFISPGVAVEDGTTTIMDTDGLPTHSVRYTAIHVKTDGKWQTASTRDNASVPEPASLEEQFDWLLGDWVDEADDSVVEFHCSPTLNGKFLSRDFTMKIAGQAAISGTQRIGRDPLTGQLKAWTFDSEGGHGQGTWYHEGENWVLRSTGVSTEGLTVTGTSIFTFIDDHTMTWQAVNHQVDGVLLPDGEIFTLVRKPPNPFDKETPIASE